MDLKLRPRLAALILPLCAALVLSGCASDLRVQLDQPQTLTATDDHASALTFYRQALEGDPGDNNLLTGYYSALERAEAFYIKRSRDLTRLDDLASAEAALGQGIAAAPESNALRLELISLQELKEARLLLRDASVASDLGRRREAKKLVEESLAKDPTLEAAVDLREKIIGPGDEDTLRPIRLQSGAPVDLNFQEASFKQAALALGRAYGVNMIFDESIEDLDISLFAENVSFQQAFTLLLKTNAAFYRRVGPNSVIIASDDPSTRAQYDDYIVRTFYIRSARAQQLADELSLILGLQTIAFDEEENTVTIRDTADKVRLADRYIISKDRKQAEVILEVEVLEVNRTKTEQLGIDFGNQISVTPAALAVNQLAPLSQLGATLGQSAVNLPAIALRYFKQQVDARTLASPRIRTLNNKEARFHIGEQVPLRTSEVIDITGQTRATFLYRDVGIRLIVTPKVRLNSSVAVDLALEVSSLGRNLGTVTSPAFVIGTRNVETQMLLDDGETAIIGGLIRDEERDSVGEVPGLGDIPAIGRLFKNRDGEGFRTDIILTITPRVLRPRDLPSVEEAEFYSGTGTEPSLRNNVDFLSGPRAGAPTIRLDLGGGALPVPIRTPVRAAPERPVAAPAPVPVLSLEENSHDADLSETVDVPILANSFPQGATGRYRVKFDPKYVVAEAVDSDIGLPARIDNTRGEIVFDLIPRVTGAGAREIALITFRGIAVGRSQLTFGAAGPGASDDDTAYRNSQILVR